MGRTRTGPSEARGRLLQTADRLFYSEGIRNVGIDKVIADAGVAKMTLYSHFASKDDLIVAVLEYRETAVLEFFTNAMERLVPKSDTPLEAFFSALREWFESPGFRGCAFQNAAVELADPAHPGTKFVREHKRRFAEILRGFVRQSLCTISGKPTEKQAAKVADRLLPMIALLVEGAIVTAAIQGTPESAEVARRGARNLVDDACR
jgi:AcrR family transcriptional regulator